ncbi:MAG: ABC transporter ATP-binding protein [Candidatus Manganitrophaceae bacterium]|nr:MAG: ABC transporter ATP-binding protein [Candidatus Manganitrophaceae bacterium]
MRRFEVKGITKSFGGLAAVKEVSFTVTPGETLGLIGPNGAGKTTLFHLITGFIRPDRGEVRCDGESLVGRRPSAICKRFGITRTFQIVRPLAHLTVLENVLVGALCRTRSIRAATPGALSALERVGLADRAGDLAGSLPIGQRKKLEIARALATRPQLLLLDEVMGGLHSHEIEGVIALLKELKQEGLTLIVVEHVMKAILALSDRIVVLNFGEKIAEGIPSEVVSHPEVIRAYLGEEAVS